MKYYLYFVVLLTKLCSFPLSCVLQVRTLKLYKVTISSDQNFISGDNFGDLAQRIATLRISGTWSPRE